MARQQINRSITVFMTLVVTYLAYMLIVNVIVPFCKLVRLW